MSAAPESLNMPFALWTKPTTPLPELMMATWAIVLFMPHVPPLHAK